MKDVILRLLIGLIKPELVFSIVNIALQAIKSAVKSSQTDWDDKVILPIIEKLEKALQ